MKLLVASHEPGGNVGLANFDVHQQLKQLEDDILDAVLALRTTRSCAEDMHRFLTCLSNQEREGHSGLSVTRDMHMDICREIDLLTERADNLRQKLKSSIVLVSLKSHHCLYPYCRSYNSIEC